MPMSILYIERDIYRMYVERDRNKQQKERQIDREREIVREVERQ